MAINKKTPEQTVRGVDSGDSCKCATSALIDYNTQQGTVTMPFGYFKEMHDRVLPDRYIQCEEKLNTLKRLLKLKEEDKYIDIESVRMVIGDD